MKQQKYKMICSLSTYTSSAKTSLLLLSRSTLQFCILIEHRARYVTNNYSMYNKQDMGTTTANATTRSLVR